MKTIILSIIFFSYPFFALASGTQPLAKVDFSAGFSVSDRDEYFPQPHEMFTKETRETDTGRPLTQGEITILTEIFKNGVDYFKVRIYNRKYAFFQPSGTIMAPNGNIYYPPGHPWHSDDYSQAYPFGSKRAIFIHEMAHVYQYHQGVSVINRRLQEGGIYEYRIEPGKDMNDYTVEQQAEIVKNYASCRLDYDPVRCSARFSPALDNFIKNPNYLRKAEQERLKKLSEQAPGSSDLP